MAYASGTANWTSSAVRVTAQAKVHTIPSNSNTCYGVFLRIHIRHTGEADACILSGVNGQQGMRLARYVGSSGGAYAVAFADDATYSRLEGFCANLSRCSYSASTDTALMQTYINGSSRRQVMIRNFSQYVTRHALPEPHYTFDYEGSGVVLGAGGVPFETGSVAVSPNGKWALIELRSKGFLRLDMQTGQQRRVIAPSAEYGQGTNPSYELAISNEGKHVAIVGWNAGIEVYEIDGACGDVMTEASGRYLAPGTVACKSTAINQHELFPGFRAAYVPRFSSDGMKLSLYVSTVEKMMKATLTPKSSDQATRPFYVALGDSFVSGEGETDDEFYLSGTNTSANTCHVSVRSYPYLLRPAIPSGVDIRNDACSGARMTEVAMQSAQLLTTANDYTVSYISVGVGGNDAGVMGKLKTCLGFDTCEWALPDRRIQTAEEVRGLYPKIITLLTDIQQTHPDATLFIVGYPRIINDSGSAQCRLPISVMLNETERQYMNETIKYLNDVLELAAQYVGVQFINVSGVFSGERLCDESEGAMNGIRVGDDIAPIASLGTIKVIGAESFHPTPRGHALVAERIRESITAEGFEAACQSCAYAATDTSPSSYWQKYAPSASLPRLIVGLFLESNRVAAGQPMQFSFPAGSFEPGGEVRLELHSDPQSLATMTADNTGALAGTVTIPEGFSGYHTVHAIGASLTGEAIDRYEVVYIGQERFSSAGGAGIKHDNTSGSELGISVSKRAAQPPSLGVVQGATAVGATVVASPDSTARTEGILSADKRLIWLVVGVITIGAGILVYVMWRRQV